MTTEYDNPLVIIEQAAQVLEDGDDAALATELRIVRTQFAELRRCAALVSNAAAKHTGASARARQGTHPNTQKLSADAIGRMHNAAKVGRASLDAGACSTCAAAAEAGVNIIDRLSDCPECGRLAGKL